MSKYYLSHLKELEAEAIYVIREVVAQFERPALLFSGGKDSIVVTHLSKKPFTPPAFLFRLSILTRATISRKRSCFATSW